MAKVETVSSAPPTPRAFVLDENLERGEALIGGFWKTRLPYLVNLAGDWDKRPGRRIIDEERSAGRHEHEPDVDRYAYDVELGHTVFAGIFMRTTTRLNTMEAANESARLAVNAILQHDADERGVAPQLCPTFDLEDFEIDDLEPLRDLDRRLHEQGRAHVLDSPWVDAAIRVIPWNLGRLLGTRGRKGGSRP
jgi:hypothetical protein